MATLSRRSIDRFVAKQGTNAKVLDLGCGRGAYARHFPNRVGCDIRPSPAVDVLADAHALPFKEGSFEMVLCTEVLEHLREPGLAIAEMYRVLRPCGRLALTTRFLYPIHDKQHDYYRFTRLGLLHLLRSWEVEVLQEDLDELSTGRQVAEFAIQTWPKWIRWPAKAVLRALVRMGGAILGPHDLNRDGAALTSGYLVLARKPELSAACSSHASPAV